jgi:hypothetical protein
MSITIYSAEKYAALSPEQKQRRYASMKRYYENNKTRILARHAARNSTETRFKCEVCNSNSFRTNYNFQKHERSNKHRRNVRLAREAREAEAARTIATDVSNTDETTS